MLTFGFVCGIASCILHLAPGILGFAFDLLRGALYLRSSIAGPFADLAFRASSRVI